eukprot:359154-Alexandrium_andersonii.AAC.1
MPPRVPPACGWTVRGDAMRIHFVDPHEAVLSTAVAPTLCRLLSVEVDEDGWSLPRIVSYIRAMTRTSWGGE